MKNSVNIYCDESCHLSCDKASMALGALVVPTSSTYKHNHAIRQIKLKYGISSYRELKWTKVSPAKLDVYQALINYFFDQPDLTFRAVVIPDKSKLNHTAFCQSHDEWYYKMYFLLLQNLIVSERQNQIYIDIKDTCGKQKVRKLHDVLCNKEYDFDRSIISRVQTIRSHEVELMSIVDLMIGAITYFHRHLQTSSSKLALIQLIQQRSELSLEKSTLLSASKFNLFVWQPQERYR